MRITGSGESYEFKADGSETKTRFGTAAWKKIDDNTWEETDKVKGNVDGKDHLDTFRRRQDAHCAHHRGQTGRWKLR
jgi:hypothetical protein